MDTCYGSVHKLHQQVKVASTPENQIQTRHTSDGEARDALRTHRISYSDAFRHHPSALGIISRAARAARRYGPGPQGALRIPAAAASGVGGGDSPAGVWPRATNSLAVSP